MLAGKDILTTKQFSMEELDLVLSTAAGFERALKERSILNNLEGCIMASLFFEASTRTRLSFEAAALRLSGRVISMPEAAVSSLAKGESIADTAKTVDGYADVIVIRHALKGSAQTAADYAIHPVINGGDGAGQHPTQALLDLYTIFKEEGRVSGLTITLLGDLKNGRTVHSLSYLMAKYGNRMIFASPPSLAMPPEITAELRELGAGVVETSDAEAAMAESDIVYVTRIQRERFEDPAEYERVKGSYIIDMKAIQRAKKGIKVMHPLPRVDEIATEVDSYEGATYFRQAHNSIPTRMALLALVTGRV
ncbi:MAG: aspartate carbamoyltransferase [Ignavibacteriales bacterium]